MYPIFDCNVWHSDSVWRYVVERYVSDHVLLMVYCHTLLTLLNLCCYLLPKQSSLVAWWSELLTTSHEVQGSFAGSAIGIFPCRVRSP
jgi:hypothetical protein